MPCVWHNGYGGSAAGAEGTCSQMACKEGPGSGKVEKTGKEEDEGIPGVAEPDKEAVIL